MRTVLIATGAFIGGAAGAFLFLKYGRGKKKCSCTETPIAVATSSSEEAPVSQPIAATSAAAMHMDGWKDPY